MDLQTKTLHASATFNVSRSELFRLLTEGATEWCSPESSLPAKVGAPIKLVMRATPQPGYGPKIGLGEVKSVTPGESISFTYGRTDTEDMPPGASLVTIELDEVPSGTTMRVAHQVHEHPTHRTGLAAERPEWAPEEYSFEMLVFLNQFFWGLFFGWVAEAIRARSLAAVTALIERWVRSFSQVPREELAAHLEPLVSPNVVVWDPRMGRSEGHASLAKRLGRAREYLPRGMRLEQEGEAKIGFQHATVTSVVRMGDDVVARVDHLLMLVPGPRIAQAELVYTG